MGAGQLLQGQQLIGGRCEQPVLMHVSSDMEAVSGQVSGSVGTSSTSRPSGFRAGETARKWKKKKKNTQKRRHFVGVRVQKTLQLNAPSWSRRCHEGDGWVAVCVCGGHQQRVKHKDAQGQTGFAGKSLSGGSAHVSLSGQR